MFIVSRWKRNQGNATRQQQHREQTGKCDYGFHFIATVTGIGAGVLIDKTYDPH